MLNLTDKSPILKKNNFQGHSLAFVANSEVSRLYHLACDTTNNEKPKNTVYVTTHNTTYVMVIFAESLSRFRNEQAFICF